MTSSVPSSHARPWHAALYDVFSDEKRLLSHYDDDPSDEKKGFRLGEERERQKGASQCPGGRLALRWL
jgi:hypothetical protein